MFSKTFKKTYLLTTLSYGLLHKTVQLHNATYSISNYKNDKTEEYPVLLCDKLIIGGIGVFIAMYYWPIYLYSDLQRFELTKRNLDPSFYMLKPKPSNMIDYIIS